MWLLLDEEPAHNCLDIFQAPSNVAFLIGRAHDGIVDVVWHTPATFAMTPKGAEKCYFIPPREVEFLFYHPKHKLPDGSDGYRKKLATPVH